MAKQQPKQIQTTLFNPWPPLILGLFCLVGGMLSVLALLISPGSGEPAMIALRDLSVGLTGTLAVPTTLLLLWLAAKLLTGLYHRVSAREAVLMTVLLLLLTAFSTLITRMNGTGETLLTFIRNNSPFAGNTRAGLSHFLRYAFAHENNPGGLGGGMIGMLIAYPLWSACGQVLSVLIVILMMIIVLFLLFLRPLRRLFSVSAPAPAVTSAAAARDPLGQGTASQGPQPGGAYVSAPEWEQSPAYDTPAPAPAAVMNAVDAYPEDDGFEPVSGEPIYNEYFPVESPAVTKTPETDMTDLDALPYTVSPAAQPEEKAKQWETVAPKGPGPSAPAKKESRKAAEDKKPAPEPSGKKKQAVTLPWEGRAKREEPRPADAQMTEQVVKKNAKPVQTDSAVELSGERIPISSSAAAPAREQMGADGTPEKKIPAMAQQRPAVHYTPPPMAFLTEPKPQVGGNFEAEDRQRATKIEETLASFKVNCKVVKILHGPAITRFAIQIAEGVRVSKVTGMADNLALSLASRHVRVEGPIQGTNNIGIEVPNKMISTVLLREVLDSREMRSVTSPLAVALGKDIAGAPVICDLSRMPHLLISGATGSGKSVCIHSIVCSLTYRTTPEQVRLIMIDPKQVELSVYNPLPHLLIPVVTDVRKAAGALAWAVQEMQDRYHSFSLEGVRNLEGYNRLHPDEKMTNIVIIIDEMADLMDVCRKEVEEYIRRLAALARAAGIYMVLATQRPSVDVITGVIKNNIPSRIAFAVSSGTDSRTILDEYGAEKLMGKGDMLYKPMGATPSRVQGCYVSDDEVNGLMQYISEHYRAEYDEQLEQQIQDNAKQMGAKKKGAAAVTAGDPDEDLGEQGLDDLLKEAIEMALEDGQTSTSMLQRRLRVGYARAGRLVDEMERLGVVSAQDGSKPRKVIMNREQYEQLLEEKGQ